MLPCPSLNHSGTGQGAATEKGGKMKKLILVSLLTLGIYGISHAYEGQQVNDCIFRSSYTKTADTLQRISGARYLKRVVVSSATAGGSIRIYDSQGSTTGQIATVDEGTLNQYDFNIYVSSGLTYSTVGNANGATFIYK